MAHSRVPAPALLPVVAAVLFAVPEAARPQTARVFEEVRTLPTYPFSEANPVPILVRDRRLYPYHAFEGYAAASRPREWKVVTLENEYIQVFVLPEVGGKVWGAVVKETGHEFIYRNEVVKFRNIALRGPWTSGGIEFNFGVIGHTPATATPVDYLLRENPDGSVSCVVGSMDLPSRTHWRVEIRLPRDRAYFETRVLWYNPTPLRQPYYNWMTAAAFVREDLEMTIPGIAYLQHSGREEAWPVDPAGRYLPLYADNTFGGHKSYHVVGELNDFFGGYYHQDDYGFGHWARYEEMPGQKLWLWALSREGGVWEDLLTDTDGQYVEFQAGRLFVQYSPGADVNPITQVGFDPMSASRWTETWFPLEGIGGLTDASRDGAMFVTEEGTRLAIGVNAFRAVTDTLKVWSGDRVVTLAPVTLDPLAPFHTTAGITPGEPFRVVLPVLGLDYSSDPTDRTLSRSFTTPEEAWASVPETTRMVFQAQELMKGRQYGPARDLLASVVGAEPWNRNALLGLAELSFRAGTFDDGLDQVNRVLQLDAYDPEANFLAGLLYRALGREADARDAFGWAARSTAYRSAAFAQLAEVMLGRRDLSEARRYASLALDADRHSVPAWRVLAVIGRTGGAPRDAEEALGELLGLDPMHHFAAAEAYLASGSGREILLSALGGEFPEQSLLELVVYYAGLGLEEDALTLLDLAGGEETNLALDAYRGGGPAGASAGGPGLVLRAWRAWLRDDPSLLAGPMEPDFAFPFRTETIPVLTWASSRDSHWVWRYLLALNLWAVERDREAARAMEDLGEDPDFGPALVARAQLLSEVRGRDPGEDLQRAVSLNPEIRVLHVHFIRHLQEDGEWGPALEAVARARSRFPRDFDLDLMEARSLIHLHRAQEATRVLAATHVLPSENARESHRIYEQAHVMAGLDALESGDTAAARRHLEAALLWPESLGQGRPYDPEERLTRFLLAGLHRLEGDAEAASAQYRSVLAETPSLSARPTPSSPAILEGRLDLLGLPALRALGRQEALTALSRHMSTGGDVERFAERLAGALAWGTESPGAAAARLAPEFPFLFSDLEGELLLRALTLDLPEGPVPGRSPR